MAACLLIVLLGGGRIPKINVWLEMSQSVCRRCFNSIGDCKLHASQKASRPPPPHSILPALFLHVLSSKIHLLNECMGVIMTTVDGTAAAAALFVSSTTMHGARQ
jgi:hypothetical protein